MFVEFLKKIFFLDNLSKSFWCHFFFFFYFLTIYFSDCVGITMSFKMLGHMLVNWQSFPSRDLFTILILSLCKPFNISLFVDAK